MLSIGVFPSGKFQVPFKQNYSSFLVDKVKYIADILWSLKSGVKEHGHWSYLLSFSSTEQFLFNFLYFILVLTWKTHLYGI